MNIKNIRDLYSQIPKQEPQVRPVVPVDNSLVSKTIDTLNKTPQLTPKVK